MSIRPISTTAPHPTDLQSLRPNTTPQPQRDTLRSYPQIGRPVNSQSKARSPLAVVCDLIECIRYFIMSQIDKVIKIIFPCLSKSPQNPDRPLVTPSAGRPGITNPLTLTEDVRARPIAVPPLPDPAAGVVEPRTSIPSTEVAENIAFRALPITDADKANIRYIVNTLARVIALPSTELERRGEEIKHVHPFIFWEYVLTEPSLIEDVKVLKSRYWGIIWGQFTDQFSKKLQATDEQGLLASHVDAFARSIRRDPEELKELMGRSWIDFLNNLVDSSGQTLTLSPRTVNSMRPDRDSDSGATTASVSSVERGSSLMVAIPDNTSSFTGLISTTGPGEAQATGGVFSPQGSSTVRTGIQKAVATISITSNQRQKLNRLLTDISQNSPILLGLQVISLKNDWVALQDVHPLRLLWEVFSNPTHVAKLDLILNNSLKKGYFLGDFANALKAGARTIELRPYFQNFAREMGIQEDSLERITTGGHYEWEVLIRYLLSIKKTAAANTTFSG